jgi:hypothetical protein
LAAHRPRADSCAGTKEQSGPFFSIPEICNGTRGDRGSISMSPTKAETWHCTAFRGRSFFAYHRELEFLYQEHTQDGSRSRFNEFLGRGSDQENR